MIRVLRLLLALSLLLAPVSALAVPECVPAYRWDNGQLVLSGALCCWGPWCVWVPR